MEHGEGSSSGVGAATMTAPVATAGVSENQSHGMPGQEFNANSKESFSSKGLSMFKDFSYSTPTPMVDINYGKGKDAPFARSENLAKEDSIFDMSKPVASESKLAPFENTQEEGVKSELSDTLKEKEPQVSPMIDINRGKVERPMFKNIESLKPKGIIDISKPYYKEVKKEEPVLQIKNIPDEHPNFEPKTESEIRKPENAKENLKNTAVVARSESDTNEEIGATPISSSVMLEETEVAIETSTLLRPNSTNETNTNTLVEQKSEPKTDSITITETQTEGFPTVATQSETKTANSQATNIEVATAENMLASSLARQESVSLTKARQAIAEAVRQENQQNKAPAVQTEQQPEEESKKKKKKTLEERATEMFHKREEEVKNAQKTEEEKEEEGILYFDKDNEVNIYRQMAVVAAAERLQRRGDEVTGAKLAEAVTSQVREGGKSEIVDGIQDDETAERVVNALSHTGRIDNSWTLRRLVRQITDRYTAVKLVSESGDGAQKEDAEKVYGRKLNGVGARFEEENSTGQIRELENGRVVYITQKPPHPLPVVSGEVASQYS